MCHQQLKIFVTSDLIIKIKGLTQSYTSKIQTLVKALGNILKHIEDYENIFKSSSFRNR